MSAALPRPDEPTEPPRPQTTDAEGWALLEAMRRKLDDQVALGRKTAAQVTQLADSIAALVDHQRRRTRNLNLNSFVAYLIFTILCSTGFYLLFRARAHELIDARDRAISERDAAVHRADEATTRSVARESADTKAWEVYELLEAGKRQVAMQKLDAMRDLPLSKLDRAVLAARAHETQVMEVEAAIKSAGAAFRAGRPADVIKPLEAALAGEPAGPRAATLHYYLGVAYARTGELEKAVANLEAAVVADVDQDDAVFQLASALDRSGAYPKARVEYDRFATAHPQSPFALFAMRRSATLARMPPAAPPAAAPAAPSTIAPAPTAPRAAPVAPPAAPAATTRPPAGVPAAPRPAPPRPASPAAGSASEPAPDPAAPTP